MDAETLVLNTLDADTELVSLLGGKVPSKGYKRIYVRPAPKVDEFPRITLFEVINSEDVAADDEALFSDVNVRIDIWTRDKTVIYDICKRLKKVLKDNLLCTVRLESTDYEHDTKIYHKPINVFLLLEQEE